MVHITHTAMATLLLLLCTHETLGNRLGHPQSPEDKRSDLYNPWASSLSRRQEASDADTADLDLDATTDTPEAQPDPLPITPPNNTDPIWSLNGTNLEVPPNLIPSAPNPGFSAPPFDGSIWFNNETLFGASLAPDLSKYFFCACNCSYVAWSCCEAEDGIVHEEPSNNQGVTVDCTPELAAGADHDVVAPGSGVSIESPAAGDASAVNAADGNGVPACRGDCGAGTCGPTGHCVCSAPPKGLSVIKTGSCSPVVPVGNGGGGKKSKREGGHVRRRSADDDLNGGSTVGTADGGELLPQSVLDDFAKEHALNASQLAAVVLKDGEGLYWNASTGVRVTLV